MPYTRVALFDSTYSTLYFPAFLLSVFLFPFFHLSDEQQPELDKKIMESLCDSTNNGGEDTYDLLYLHTGYEPKGHDFDELQNSSVPFSFKIPNADQDVDDVTLGEMLTAAHRGQVDYCVPEGVSVSQSLSVVFDRTRKPVGERDVDQSIGFGVTRNTYSAHSFFLKTPKLRKWSHRSGQPDECNSSKAQIRTLLEEQRQTIIVEYREKVSQHELQAAQAEEERQLLQGQSWQQKLEFREAHQQSLTEMEELRKFQSSAFDTIARRKLIEDQNTILELSGQSTRIAK